MHLFCVKLCTKQSLYEALGPACVQKLAYTDDTGAGTVWFPMCILCAQSHPWKVSVNLLVTIL